ncbi:Ubiquitin- modifier 1 [Coemansia erecta]|uniref:Ubiquitin-related modifier 1 n=1 Tax=Coemansia erecta TaxID=147472 RepID=A0A9W7XX15_9FUNG|nr:Ubiquitin- modifier 1 [Coemansia erecta]
MSKLAVTLRFVSGAELLIKDEFRAQSNKKSGDLEFKHEVPAGTEEAPLRMKELIEHVRDNLVKGDKDQFYKDGKLRPGILVIINGSDWEVEDGPEYKVQADDVIEFISTLHGG